LRSAFRRGGFGELWKLLTEENPLPLVVAVQGLALVLVALFATSEYSVSNHSGEASSVAGIDANESVPSDWHPELPADLIPKRLPLPRVFEPSPETSERIAAREDSEGVEEAVDDDSEGLQSRLAAMRVTSVRYHAPVAVKVALGAPEAPAQLSPGTIPLAGFRRGVQKPARRGFGGRGIEGSGIGIGGFGIGGGECARGPRRPPGIIERTRAIVPY
jgi:hypothetical protein